MPRNITITFADGTSHVYQNAPDDVTPAAVQARAEKEFGKSVAHLDGGRGTPSEIPAPRQPSTWEKARPYVASGLETAGAIGGGVIGSGVGLLGAVAGAGLGLGAARQLMKAGDVAFGAPVTPTTPGEVLGDVATGAAMEGAGRVVIPAAAKAAGWVWDAAKGNLVQMKAGKVLREIAGDKLSEIKAALANAQPGVTAGQAVAGEGVNAPTFQSMERLAANKRPEAFTDIYKGQEAAREAGLKAVTPDLQAAIAAREASSKPLYQAAESKVISVDPQMRNLFDRLPKGTLEKAADIARMEGKPFDPTQSMSGESLHYIKRALSDIANAPAAAGGLGRDAQAAARGVLSDYLPALEKRIPEYGQARQAFAQGSQPVNQSTILNEMLSILKRPGGGERAGPFLNVLGRGEQALLKRSTGFPRYESGDLSKVLTPDQMGTVNKTAAELTRDAEMARQASAGNMRLGDVLKMSQEQIAAPNILNAKITMANKVAGVLQGRVSDATLKKLTEGMLSGRGALDILNAVPAAERSTVLKALQNANWGRTIPAATNALITATQPNQNALAGQ